MDVMSSKKRDIDIYCAKECHFHRSFIIFNNQPKKLHLPPKDFNEKCSNYGIWQESVPGLHRLTNFKFFFSKFYASSNSFITYTFLIIFKSTPSETMFI